MSVKAVLWEVHASVKPIMEFVEVIIKTTVTVRPLVKRCVVIGIINGALNFYAIYEHLMLHV